MNNKLLSLSIHKLDSHNFSIQLNKVLTGTIINEIIQEIIVLTIKKYNNINNTIKYDNCTILCILIEQLNKYIEPAQLIYILNTIVIIKNDVKYSLLDYVYINKLFFDECDLITLLWKNKVPMLSLNNYYLTYIYEHYMKTRSEQEVLYHIIKNCKIIDLSSNTDYVINNLIYLFQAIKNTDYHKYKTIYMSFEHYDDFYKINQNCEHIKYFMINVLFFTMLEKINYKSMYNLMKTIIYNRELLSYLRKVLREDQTIIDKYRSINEIAKDSLFINSEHQILLNKMIDTIFNFDTSTTSIINNL